MDSSLRRAGMAGIAYIALSAPLIALAIVKSMHEELGVGFQVVFVVLTALALVAYLFFIFGFRDLAVRTANTLLEVVCYLLVVFSCMDLLFVVAEFWLPEWAATVYGFSVLLLYGMHAIAFGIGVLRLESLVGPVARVAGVLEIVAGGTFVTMLFAPVGLLLIIPTLIVEVVLLFKTSAWLSSDTVEPPPLRTSGGDLAGPVATD